jgi:adenylate cyclase
MEKLFNPYLSKIKNVLNLSIDENMSSFDGSKTIKKLSSKELQLFDNTFLTEKFLDTPDAGLVNLGRKLGVRPSKNHSIGQHPDYIHLIPLRATEYHEIVSIFIDLKGSKNLLIKYGNDTAYYITNVIQSLAIHVCTTFGGYIQRIEGDGLFVYFGEKDLRREDYIRNSLIANSIITYFVKNDLKELFEEDGIERVNTRTGIDFGYNEDIMWAVNGTYLHYELTTTGLHTSLAKTMQSNGSSNSIIVGDNIKQNCLPFESLFTDVKKSNGEVIKYVYNTYRQYDFNWYNFLKFLNLLQSQNGNEYLLSSPIDNETQNLLDSLRRDKELINSNRAHTSSNLSISPSGKLKNQEHSFYYNDIS